jgi:hypothetical protein
MGTRQILPFLLLQDFGGVAAIMSRERFQTSPLLDRGPIDLSFGDFFQRPFGDMARLEGLVRLVHRPSTMAMHDG